MLAHTNADDDTRYRERKEVQEWVARDPLTRLQTYLRGQNLLNEADEAELATEAESMAAKVRDSLNSEPDCNPEDIFNYVYTERPAMLDAQWAVLSDEIARTEA